jgi:endo-1,4-beta-xylanase
MYFESNKFVLMAVLVSCLMTAACLTKDGKNMEASSQNEDTADWETYSGNSHGNRPLPGSPYGYEIWSAGGSNNQLIWYGPFQKGGAAFRAEWNYPDDFLGRVGYFWNQGRPYTHYKNVFCDFDFTRSANGTAGNYSYIGIYGWSRNPMIEWYIVEDWFGSGNLGPSTMGGGASKKGEFTVDDAVYFIYQATRPSGSGNIEGSRSSFPQFFSVRQTRRQSGTVSITEHFKEWERIGMKLGTNMYEAKFLVEAGGGTGWFDASHISFYQKDE